MSEPKPRSRSGHKPTAALIDALNDAGWTLTASNFPGHALLSHPRSGEEMPTPDYMRGSRSWPFDTFYRLRQLSFISEGDRIVSIWARECAAPWVVASERRVSFKKAMEYVNEQWAPDGAPETEGA